MKFYTNNRTQIVTNTDASSPRFHRDDLLTDQQLQDPTGFSTSFWQARRLRGDGPTFIRISSRAVRYRWGDVLDWLESLRRTSTSDQGGAK